MCVRRYDITVNTMRLPCQCGVRRTNNVHRNLNMSTKLSTTAMKTNHTAARAVLRLTLTYIRM